ncbi:MAG: hypothetical protein AAFR17_20450 [Pseudomonadota bacterium]
MTRSPLTAFAGERLPGIGHNQGPPMEAGHGFRVHAWKKARRQLMPRLPLEILKRRVARARELGLAYPHYASILLGSGRDVVAFLFTCEALGLRLQRAGARPIPDATRDRLAGLASVGRLLMVPEDAGAEAPLTAEAALTAQDARRLIDRIGQGPRVDASLAHARTRLRSLLSPDRLAGDQVVLIGTRPVEREWAESARFAKFLPASQYFDQPR